ncbi:uncharacterized protein OCT59_018446 [Rhizophagus irregularis]|uniref:uncharacterized protein n=1 Tax=Rhizophagus irregularis TaxID=588596 RepID=UPI00331BF860|nr:hypothetical protein OCT59_018446 [Rhizophagus irregularis]
MNMNREVFKERQRILNAERQQHFRNQNQKCPSEKKNIPITRPTKKTKKVGNEVNQASRCGKCGAMMWIDETVNKSSKSPVFTICCANGKVILPLLQELPYPLNILLLENNPHSRLFQLSVIPNLDFNILIELQQMLHEINPYVNIFHQAGQLLRNDPLLDLRLAIIDNRTRDS